MNQSLPERPNLDHLKGQAKALLSAFRTGDLAARGRVAESRPHLLEQPDFALHDAQSVLAKEYGFDSWAKLRAHVIAAETSQMTDDERSDAFVEAILEGRLSRGEAILAADPAIPQRSLAAACVYADIDSIQRLLDAYPEALNAQTGSRAWAPILYACFSGYAKPGSARTDEVYQAVELLADRGADLNAFYLWNDDPANPIRPLYAAVGLYGNIPLAHFLLDRGAMIDDNESLYHSTEHRDHAGMKLLMERGVRGSKTNALKHMLDFDDIEGLKLLLDYGLDPNEYADQSALHFAIVRDRSLAHIEMLLKYGAHVESRDRDGKTPFDVAWRRGRSDLVDLLRTPEGEAGLSLTDRFIGACWDADRAAADRLREENPDLFDKLSHEDHGMIAQAAWIGKTEAVRLMLDEGFDIGVLTPDVGTPLHASCWPGHAETAVLLIERGAPLEILDQTYKATPFGWACHGSIFNQAGKPENYVAILQNLFEAGAKIPERSEGNDIVNDWLQAHR